MMKKLVLFLSLFVAMACGPATTHTAPPAGCYKTGDGSLECTPAGKVNLADQLLAALGPCASTITWSIQESSDAGFTSPLDGAITQQGLYTAPSCGSSYIGSVQHVQAAGCAKSAVAAVKTPNDLIQTLGIYGLELNPGTTNACMAVHVGPSQWCPGADISDPTQMCPADTSAGCACIQAGQVGQWMARQVWTCETVYNQYNSTTWSTTQPTLPATCGDCYKLTCP